MIKAKTLAVIKVKADTTSTQKPARTAQITGQEVAKRALEIAAAGGHHLLMIGPPGAGKTLLAASLPPLLEDPNPNDQLELSLMRDLLGMEPSSGRPFRAPHHSTTAAGLIGGGINATPGEVSLAHGGVLFLDELAEFRGTVLDLLRQPLESGHISLSRAKGTYQYPARVVYVASILITLLRCTSQSVASIAALRLSGSSFLFPINPNFFYSPYPKSYHYLPTDFKAFFIMPPAFEPPPC